MSGFKLEFVGKPISAISKFAFADAINAMAQGKATFDQITLIGHLLKSHLIAVHVQGVHQEDLFETVDHPFVVKVPRVIDNTTTMDTLVAELQAVVKRFDSQLDMLGYTVKTPDRTETYQQYLCKVAGLIADTIRLIGGDYDHKTRRNVQYIRDLLTTNLWLANGLINDACVIALKDRIPGTGVSVEDLDDPERSTAEVCFPGLDPITVVGMKGSC
jgi:hypothetical protein